MKKVIIILLTILFSNLTFSQQTEIKWSPFGEKEKKEVLKIAKKFMDTYADNDFQSLQKMLPKDEINYGGDIWLKTQEFKQMLQSLRGKNQIEIGEIHAYTMNDTEKNPDIKEKTLKIYRMFSNFSIFVTAEIIDKSDDTKKTIYLNFNIENKNWVVSSYSDVSVGLINKTSLPKDRFRIESFDDLNFEIPVPKDFSKGKKMATQMTYVLKGETKRDAAIQVDNRKLKASVGILSYDWVQYVTTQYEHSDILIKYMPYGYKYEYFVKDENGISNKGITVAFESNKKFVYIQYFSFAETYNKIYVDIDSMLRNIKIK